MDYGYQLLRHVLQQVFGNLGAAARLTILPIVIPLVIVIVLNAAFFAEIARAAETGVPPSVSGGAIATLFLSSLLVALGWCWSAVSWHRYVLLEIYPTGWLPPLLTKLVLSYFLRVLLISIILTVAAMALLFLVVQPIALSGNGLLLFLLATGITIGFSWAFVRMALILPAASIEQRVTVRESWKATGPVAGHILLPIIVISLAVAIINSLLGLLGFLGGLGAIFLGWVQLLMNLALLTTLYGNLIEGRQLN